MKKYNLWKISIRTWKRLGFWSFAVSAVFWCSLCLTVFYGVTVYAEKQASYELMFFSDNLSDSVISEIASFDDIESVSPIINVPCALSFENTVIEIAVSGINRDYIADSFLYGSNFQEVNAMPYIAMNKSAADILMKVDKKLTPELIIGKQILMTLNEKTFSAKISGIFDNEEEDPVCYISLTNAKNLILNVGDTPSYSSAYVRCTNADRAKSVSEQLNNMGLQFENANTDIESKQNENGMRITYLIIITVLALIAAIAIVHTKRVTNNMRYATQNEMLRSMGLTHKDITAIHRNQFMLMSMYSMVIGVIIFLLIIFL